jgi:hypothetical protein
MATGSWTDTAAPRAMSRFRRSAAMRLTQLRGEPKSTLPGPAHARDGTAVLAPSPRPVRPAEWSAGLVVPVRIRSLQIRAVSSAAAGWPWLAIPGGWVCVMPAMFASRCLPAVPRGPAGVPGAAAARQNGETAD